MLVLDHGAFRPGDVGIRHVTQRKGQRLDDHVVDRKLVGRLAVLFGSSRIELCAQRQKRIQFAIHGNVEMRNRLLGFDQTLGDDLAHAVMRHQLVGALFEQLENRFVRLTLGEGRSRCASSCCCRSGFRTTGSGSLFHVGLDDATMRAGTGDGRKIETGFLRKTTRKRRSEDALAGLCNRCRRGRCGRLIGGRLFSLGRSSVFLRRFGLNGFLLRCFGLCFRLGRSGIAALCRLGHILAIGGEDGDQGVDLDGFGAGRNNQLGNRAFVHGFHFHGRLVGLDLGDHVTGCDLVAFLDQPFGQITLFHGGRKGRHGDVDRHD